MADLTGDGIPDIITANRSDNSVSVLLGNPDGSFQTKETYRHRAGCPFSVAVADLNGDGIPDIVTANYDGSSVSVLLGNGNGTFQPYYDLPAGSDPYDVKVADLTGDGNADIVVTNKNDNTVGVLLGNGNGTFQPMVSLPRRLRSLRGRGGRPHRQRHPRPGRQPLQRDRGRRAAGQRQRHVPADAVNSRSARGPTGSRWPT